MNDVVNSISIALLFVASLVFFALLIKTVLPATVLKLGSSLGMGVGRGYRRFVYPTGRAVSYEPHPSVRKFVNKYLLFVNDGYKYFKCRVDKGVRDMKYTLIMVNNKDKVIDTLVVEETIGDSVFGADVLLHPDTSYVALSVESVNGIPIRPQSNSYYRLLTVGIYFIAVMLISFFELLIASLCVEKFTRLVFSISLPVSGLTGKYFLWSLLIAAISVLVLILYCRRKGIKVVLNGK